MTSRDAFFITPMVLKTSDDPTSAISKDLFFEKGSHVIGACGRCSDCEIVRERVVNVGGTFKSVTSTGAMATFGPERKLTISDDFSPKYILPSEQLDREFCRSLLCDSCSKLDIVALTSQVSTQTASSPNFERLIRSSKSCPLCALVASTLVDEFSFQPDDERPVTLEPMIVGKSIEIRFPKQGTSSVVDVPSGLKRRLPRSPDDPVIARHWLSECLRSHEKCKANSESALQANRLSRLVNVSLVDGDDDPYLEECVTEGDYLTLSYCWGDPSTVTTTTKESLEEFKDRIPFASLSRIFKDAIQFTRLLGVKYIWIDALCVVQDCPEDKTQEIPRMADIYGASLLTLLACIATSGESRLFELRLVHNLIQLPVQPAQDANALIYVTNQDLHGFSDDVSKGHLGSRGWCFQERLLTTRLLHFGEDQFHWECHEALQSESNTQKFWYNDLTSRDDGRLRENIASDIVFQEPPAHASEQYGPDLAEVLDAQWNEFIDEIENLYVNKEKKPEQKLEVARRRPQYDAWYSAVSSYTNRDLTNATDRLPALSGAAARFAGFIKDTYAAGLWACDMSRGLLWSRTAFTNVEVDESIAIPPGLGGRGDSQRMAPTWSWASVDGAVHWMQHREGTVFLVGYELVLNTKSQGVYGEPDQATMRVKGNLLEIEEISLLRDGAKQPELRTDFENRLATYPRRLQPQMDFDDPGFEAWLLARGQRRQLYLLLVPEIPGQQEGSGDGSELERTPASLGELGYALLLRYWSHDETYRRVGIARVALRDFMGSELRDIHIR